MTDEFKQYAKQVVDNSKGFAQIFINAHWKIISNGTDNHMFVLDVYHSCGLTGKEAEEALDEINITVNKNQIPNDELPPLKSSGIRMGTAAMTSKGWVKSDFMFLADIIIEYLLEISKNKESVVKSKYIERVKELITKS